MRATPRVWLSSQEDSRGGNKVTKYIIKRILWAIPVLLGVLIIVYTITYLTPGDPVMTMLGNGYTAEKYAKKAAELGLDKGYLQQLGTYIWNIVTKFDFGKSFMTNIPVVSELSTRIVTTFKIAFLSIIVTILIGIPCGIIAAIRQYSPLDYTFTSLALLCSAIPSFVNATVLLVIFGVKLRWLPLTGLDEVKSYILPVFVNALGGIALLTRMTRTSMLETIRQDYIRTARAKGLKSSAVIWKHAMKNTMIPVITVTGSWLAMLMGGALIVELIFSIPGLGTYLYSGISNRDYPIINGAVILTATIVCVMSIVVDILYAAVDPRIKAQFAGGKKKKKTSGKKAEVA